MGEFRKMNTVKLAGVYNFCDYFDCERLTLNASALKVVTDFTRRAPKVILKDVDIAHAL
ncbi:hypothetical protein [Pseudoalteromonas sp. MMG022]|uniref:hypothetical protein n=1 Tax=Pseudoalteromonas sp. MMG022 TaxID=2909978 RepID=UPI001F1EE1F7|nr:hypothetical protein [Pseudoalteromonas sp. MMG022]